MSYISINIKTKIMKKQKSFMDSIKIKSTPNSIEFFLEPLEPKIKIYTIEKGKKVYRKNNSDES